MQQFMAPVGVPHFIRKAEAFVDLREDERRSMLANIQNVVSVGAGQVVRQHGERVRRILIVLSGAMVESMLGQDGRTQNFRFLFPGDAVGGEEIGSHHHAHDVRSLTAGTYAWVDKGAVPASGDSRLSRLFFAVRLAEQAILNDRLRVIGRERAETRLIHLMLELHARQRLTAPELGNKVWRPFPQADIGDALGLTNVYVSKTLAHLRESGVMSVDGNVVTLHEPEALARRIGFIDRYADIDVERIRRPAVPREAAE